MSWFRWLFMLSGLLFSAGLSAEPEAVATQVEERQVEALGIPEAAPAPEVAASPAAERALRALDLIGTPYKRRGMSPDSGFDCSGFVSYVFRSADGTELPRTANEMFRLRESERVQHIERVAIEPGDLLFFRIRKGGTIDHVGIALGEGRFIHAPASGGAVRIDALDNPYWTTRFAGARRFAFSPR